MSLFLSVFIKFFFLLTPFFVLTMFLALTEGMSRSERHKTAVQVAVSVVVVTQVLFHFGTVIFDVFGITVDSFRIGAGSLLFLSAVALVRGRKAGAPGEEEDGNIAVVPLAIPITVGPATIGALLIMGATLEGHDKLMGSLALVAAVFCVGVILYLSSHVQRLVGSMGLSVLTKITGLILSALAAQIVFTGIRNFMLNGA